MVYGPVGVKCRECASLRPSHLYQIPAGRLILTILATLAVSALTGGLLHLGFLSLFWIALPLGYGIGALVLKVSGNKRGTLLEIATGISVILGALGGQVAWAAWHILQAPAPILSPGSAPSLWMAFGALLDPLFVISCALTTAAAVSKIRYW